MRYTKYIKYIVCFMLINIILIGITILKSDYKNEFALWLNTPLINEFLNGFLMSISTGIIVYVFTAIHTEKIEFYKNENDIISILPNLQNYRNKIRHMTRESKDIYPEEVLKELIEFRDYCSRIINYFYLAGVENSRSGVSEDISFKLLYNQLLKHVIECERIWRNIVLSINSVYQYKSFDDNFIDGVIMETVSRLDHFLNKHTQFLAVYTTTILYSKKIILTEKNISKKIRKNPLYKIISIQENINCDLEIKTAFQNMVRDSYDIAVKITDKHLYVDLRTTYRYVFSAESLYIHLLKKYKGKKNKKCGFELKSDYSSAGERETVNICVDDLIEHDYIEIKEYGSREIYYITKQGRKIVKKYKNGEELYIDLRTGKKVCTYPALIYDVLENYHIKLSNR